MLARVLQEIMIVSSFRFVCRVLAAIGIMLILVKAICNITLPWWMIVMPFWILPAVVALLLVSYVLGGLIVSFIQYLVIFFREIT